MLAAIDGNNTSWASARGIRTIETKKQKKIQNKTEKKIEISAGEI